MNAKSSLAAPLGIERFESALTSEQDLKPSNQTSWVPPVGIERVLIAGDTDESFTPQGAALTLARRLEDVLIFQRRKLKSHREVAFCLSNRISLATLAPRQPSAHIHRHHSATHLYCTVVHSDAPSAFFDAVPNLQL